ncbi:uncharacterized protein LOC117627463 isoform X2 [Prunus dulcis]|uniref:uncharacterized protein LOC117627463 isoform X2 n=1 Tax=Prunus dulcis TaxID=3755 RepID=UPI001481F0F2|nr:uncharacterized protein LOC117627463 isoform X2 [Prunus dulcis]
MRKEAEAQVELAKKRCRDVIDRIEGLPASTKITASCRRTLLKLAHSELTFLCRCCSSTSSSSSTPLNLSVNIGHLEAVVHLLQQPFITGVSRVCKPIPLSTLAPHPHGQKTDPCLKIHVHVDIVCTLHRNPVWIIVSDRNPKYISWSGSSCGSPYKRDKSKGLKLRIQQVTAAARSAVALKPSSVILFFSNRNGLSSIVCDKLKDEFGATEFQLDFPVLDFNFDLSEEAGEWTNVLVARTYQEACAFEIKVSDTRNTVLSSESDVKDSSLGEAAVTEKDPFVSTEHTEFFRAFSNLISGMEFYSLYLKNGESAQVGSLLGQSELINFDTTALIALVSGISNGGTPKLLATPESELRQRFKGNYEFVIGQVMSEIQNPILVELGRTISGKRVIICESVRSEFKELVLMCGGPNEKLRASQLLNCLTEINTDIIERIWNLPTTRKLALKNKVVFGTGDYWCAPTVTANMAFVRAISQTGMSLFTIEHRPRALTGD